MIKLHENHFWSLYQVLYTLPSRFTLFEHVLYLPLQGLFYKSVRSNFQGGFTLNFQLKNAELNLISTKRRNVAFPVRSTKGDPTILTLDFSIGQKIPQRNNEMRDFDYSRTAERETLTMLKCSNSLLGNMTLKSNWSSDRYVWPIVFLSK